MKNVLSIFLVVTSFLFVYPAAAQTYLGPTVSGTLGPEGNPYVIADYSLIVPEDSILTLLPGVVIQYTNTAYFNIYGQLIADGTEEDSIYFEEMHGYPNYMSVSFRDDCLPGSSIDFLHSYEVRFELYNTADISIKNSESFTLDSRHGASTNLYIENCRLSETNFIWDDDLILIDCEIEDATQCSSSDLLVENCVFNSFFSGSDCVAEFDSCIFYDEIHYGNASGTHPTSYIYRDCRFYAPIGLDSFYGNASLYRCIIDVRDFDDDASAAGCVVPEAVNNVIFANYVGLGLCSYAENNIISADIGIIAAEGAVISFNDFYNCSTAVYGDYTGFVNYYDDPLLKGGEPFDYSLQPGSPCIDAGYNLFPLDPDSTIADLGAIFYDQRLDNPPVITAEVVIDVYPDSSFTFEITAVDDGDTLFFEIEGLPEWVYIQEDDFTSSSCTIGGTVPDDALSSSFTAYVRDEINQCDSQEFTLRVNHTPLSGSISGVLTSVIGNYTVIDEIVVEEGDTLTIKPGVTLFFNEPEFDWNILNFHVYGTLIAEGTEADSIYFVSSDPDPQGIDWRGLYTHSSSSVYLSYCEFRNFDHNTICSHIIEIDNCNFTDAGTCFGLAIYEPTYTISINNSSFNNSNYAIDLYNEGTLNINDCEFSNNNYSIISYMGTNYHPILNISHSTFCQNGENMTIYGYDDIVVDNCQFIENVNNDLFLYDCGMHISNNLFSHSHGIYFYDEVYGFTHDSLAFINNTVDNCFRGLYLTTEEVLTESIIIENNIITNCSSYGIGFGEVPAGCELSIEYNDVYNNTENYSQCEPGLTNISLDPEFFGVAPYEHNLMPGSPCIDAGNPVSPLDPDGSRADMGAFFYDHQNTPPEIISVTPAYLDTALTGSFVEFSVDAIDLDLDSLYYSWRYNGITMCQQSNYSAFFSETGTDTVSITVSDGNGSDDHQWIFTVVQGSGVNPPESSIPLTYYLDANYPNPFNHTTRIAFGLPDDGMVKLRIFNILGREVEVLIDDYKIAGRYNIDWRMEDYLSSGLYICSLEARSDNQTVFNRQRKMLYIK